MLMPVTVWALMSFVGFPDENVDIKIIDTYYSAIDCQQDAGELTLEFGYFVDGLFVPQTDLRCVPLITYNS